MLQIRNKGIDCVENMKGKDPYIKSIEDLSEVQKASYELIQSDARFLYSLLIVATKKKIINTNYVSMCLPYIGVFTDGAEQWCKKVGLGAPRFTKTEKNYYSQLRLRHKVFEMSYQQFLSALKEKLAESDEYFYDKRGLLEKTWGYCNVGTDVFGEEYVGNTILCALYLPENPLTNKHVGVKIKELSVIAGKLVYFFKGNSNDSYMFNYGIKSKCIDYHFFNSCPLKNKTDFDFLLFSVLCSINYVIEFVDKFIDEEIPQKLKLAYLQYYYLCDFITDLNTNNGTHLYINDSLKNRDFRNCLAHYGLGQYLHVSDIIATDPLKGLTDKAFDMNYTETKEALYLYLSDLVSQIKEIIFIS